MKNSPSQKTDVGDFMKIIACTAVILQSVLSFAMTKHPSINNQIAIGIIYNFIKFTAPVFIFGILYSTIRTTPYSSAADYPNYAKKQYSALIVPTFWWTLIYLIFLPMVQQVNHYTDWKSFLWQFINGNAAPHLWYNTMMLQFILLMPIFWYISNLSKRSGKLAFTLLVISLVIYIIWIEFYYHNVFIDQMKHQWYLLDRVFLSFFIYGLLGVLFVNYRWNIKLLLHKYRWILIIAALLSVILINYELFQFGTPIHLSNAPYYKLSMVAYDTCIILLIATLAFHLIKADNKILPKIHFLSVYAYRAYLSNVFWLVIVWKTLNFQTSNVNLWIIIIVTYLTTSLLSFTSALLLSNFWSTCKKLLRN
ncbi:acyltransferase [Companilactobacillus ginsenosidimutans]|uniref:Acyltransferase 3 domain-containing protein n=1 Tax=Companilactobacillus ginsenosidimutans TaxID=1007676 RepID=A0A0H4QYK9_9LACO|nr:acyltransferase [Companilactobacillus ginsenosidimutans]AKP66560.1 hypothetical protein ABM34_02655 [Companilactobacillus ginsenosidimutans]